MTGTASPEIICTVVGPLATNCYVLGCPETSEAVIVDPGGDPDLIEEIVRRKELKPVLIISTHGHSDHIAAVVDLKAAFKVDFAIHAAAREIVRASVIEAPLWGMGSINEPSIDRTLAHGDTIRFGSVEGTVRHTPGHSPGGISILFDTFVLAGDTLFAGSIGRTDLLGGDFDTLLDSIRRELLTLPGETIVYCGHGPHTRIEIERAQNPFITGAF